MTVFIVCAIYITKYDNERYKDWQVPSGQKRIGRRALGTSGGNVGVGGTMQQLSGD